jgi:hypothetical protein
VITYAILSFVKIFGLDSRAFDTPGFPSASMYAVTSGARTQIGIVIGSKIVAELVSQLMSPTYWASQGAAYSALLAAEAFADYVIVVGWIVGATAAYYFSKWSLKKTIDMLEETAVKLTRELVERLDEPEEGKSA